MKAEDQGGEAARQRNSKWQVGEKERGEAVVTAMRRQRQKAKRRSGMEELQAPHPHRSPRCTLTHRDKYMCTVVLVMFLDDHKE